jgi:Protein of unknown function (DUF2946)
MRNRAPVQGWLRLGTASAMVLGLLLQLVLLSGGAVAEPTDPLRALGGICHAVDDGGAPQPATGHDHAHCPLCQSGTVAFLVPELSPLLRVFAVTLIRQAQAVSPAPGGMLRLAYASRAPPVTA